MTPATAHPSIDASRESTLPSCTAPVPYSRHMQDAAFHLAQARAALARAERQASARQRRELDQALPVIVALQRSAREGAHQAARADRRSAA